MNLRPGTLSSLRLTNPCAAKCFVNRTRGRHFSQSQTCPTANHGNPPNHYDVLGIGQHATQAELKKQFYVLSKETHPDLNRDNPEAGKRFMQISESYSVLGDPEKRKRYDRDMIHVHGHRHHHGTTSSHHHRGTHAGHRPPSGLSRRRSAFKGPPPSFYAHGKPSANTSNQARASQAGTFNASAFADEGKWDPDFDARSTYKTQTLEDYRRASRRAAELAAAQAEIEADNFWGRFLAVTSVIVLGVSLGTVIVGMANTPRGGLTRGDGSRRGGPRNEWTKG
ncbi:hypothetical protein A1O1_06525 [Capronia coronata CBS 617.96]|uniref:J domain-containing protein n=1 Tax=Capronia coronata CBS 617.96 TaxID=1182541 RepID=W9Y924_9EURO|nr:uncharacterized protein A1O1_06525 [Capronia coronata CBS 617.96]EXJ86155.1 hypothetical protein A1O1_06525 [Capronia coronata CBS 617.96]